MKHSKLVLGLVVLLSAAVLVGCGEKKDASAPDAKLDTSSGMLNDVADGAIKAWRPIKRSIKRPIKEELIEAIRNAPGISRPQLMVVVGKGRTSVTEALAFLQKDG